jgi:hypothetical protein
MRARVPTSDVLNDLLKDAPADHVTLGWVLDSVQEVSLSAA